MQAVVLAVALAAALPSPATVVPGESLGGVRLRATPAQVTDAWGTRRGVCRSCAHRTWYFTYRAFEPQGAGVEFRGGRAAALFTLWQPAGWRTREGLRLGEDRSRVTALYGPLPVRRCEGYEALVLRRGQARTVFYVLRDEVWGFGLVRSGVPVCRE